jgi:hypothetical protein
VEQQSVAAVQQEPDKPDAESEENGNPLAEGHVTEA